jgi:hypothetical protein
MTHRPDNVAIHLLIRATVINDLRWVLPHTSAHLADRVADSLTAAIAAGDRSWLTATAAVLDAGDDESSDLADLGDRVETVCNCHAARAVAAIARRLARVGCTLQPRPTGEPGGCGHYRNDGLAADLLQAGDSVRNPYVGMDDDRAVLDITGVSGPDEDGMVLLHSLGGPDHRIAGDWDLEIFTRRDADLEQVLLLEALTDLHDQNSH